MNCQEAQENILDSLDDVILGSRQRELSAHVAGCQACADFAAKQKALDAQLTQLFAPPEMSHAFRVALHRRIRREGLRAWVEALPDILHFTGCGVATALAAAFLPYAPATVFGIGLTTALFAYFPLLAIRDLFTHSEAE